MRAFNAGDNSKRGPSLSVLAVGQGLFLTFLLIILVSVVLAVLVSFLKWQTNTRLLNMLVHASVTGGAILAGRRCKRKAWLNGVAVGLVAFLILTWLGENQVLLATWLWWRRLFRMGVMAVLGGILGGLLSH